MKIPASVSLALLAVTTVVEIGYMTVGVLDIDPRKDYNEVTVELTTSGGLMDTSQVLLRGLKVGNVTAVEVTDHGLAATLKLDGAYDIPLASEVRIANLSAAGEQYIEFRPASASGPFLTDGSIIPSSHVKSTATVSDVLSKVNALTEQINPDALQTVVDALTQGFADAGPEIANVTNAGLLIARTLKDKRDEIVRIYSNAQTLSGNVARYGPVLTELSSDIVDATPELLHFLRALKPYADVSDGVWQEPIGTVVDKLNQYITTLSPDLAFIATVVKPATAQLRPLRLDLGSMMEILLRAFPSDGPARVAVSIPK